MAKAKVKGSGTKQSPWVLKTPPGTSEFEAYRDETLDPPTLIAVALAFGLVATFASYWPARRATKVDPLVALRFE